MNLADLPAVDRQLIEADKIACMIRTGVKGMSKADRDRHAREKLGRLTPDMRELVLEQMRKRANEQKNRN